MKKILLLLAIATIHISCNGQSEFTPEALVYNLQTLEGTSIPFSEVIKKHEGKTVVIEIWASWCGDCVKNMPKLKELQANHPDANYVFLSVDRKIDAWKKGIEKHELKGDHYLIADGMKGNFGKAINLDWIPRYIIVDKTGKIALYKAIETDHEKVNSTLTQIK
jgi:thiol-disulfide isomerase/thioredoxin